MDILRTWETPGAYLCTPVDGSGEDLDLPNTPYVLEFPPDHIYFKEKARLTAATPPGAAPPPQFAGYPGVGAGLGVDRAFDYLQAKDESTLAREMADRKALLEREARIDEARADLHANQFGIADKVIDSYTNVIAGANNQLTARMNDQAEAERSWYDRAAQRDRDAMKGYADLQNQGLAMVLKQSDNQLERMRLDSEARERAYREERDRREAREKEERDRREARERQDEIRRNQERAEQRDRDREHQAAMLGLITAKAEAMNPMNSLMQVGAMLGPALVFAEKLGVIDALKEKFLSKEEPEEASDWAGVVKETVKQIGEVGKAMFEGGPQLEVDDDDEEIELYEREDGLLQDDDGNLYDPETEEELTEGEARAWLVAHGRGITDKTTTEVPDQPVTQEVPEHVKVAREAHGDAYREVGGPAALAAMNRQHAVPGVAPSEAEAQARATEGKKTGLRKHPADAAGIPAEDQREARKLMKALVKALGKNKQDDWVTLTVKAVKRSPKAMQAYLKATTIRKAAEEAGADDTLINRYIGGLNKYDGPFKALIADIPRG